MKRRNFVINSALTSAGALIGAPMLTNSFAKTTSPNDVVGVGVIGCNGMGWANTYSILKNENVELLGICDVDESVIANRKTQYQEMKPNGTQGYTDYRKLLDDKNIDAIIIGTPDHWHCKMLVDALDAGKHIYVEKPVANSIAECDIMIAAANKYGKVIQVGQWQRSGPHYQQAIEIVQSGKLGKIRLVKVWAYQGWVQPIAVIPDSKPPPGVDYKMWLGPAPNRPFNQNRFHFNFRWFWDYAGGLMTDWGVHEIDIALLTMRASAPESVFATGGKLAYPDDASETPDTLQAIYQYKDFGMLWEHATGIDTGPYNRREGIAFIGNNGTLIVNRDGYEVIVEREGLGYSSWGENKMEPIEKVSTPEGVSYLDLHTTNFLEAIRSDDPTLAKTPMESGSIAAINAQMGNISYKTGKKLIWDNQKGSFDYEEANKLIKASYHNGWELPSI